MNLKVGASLRARRAWPFADGAQRTDAPYRATGSWHRFASKIWRFSFPRTSSRTAVGASTAMSSPSGAWIAHLAEKAVGALGGCGLWFTGGFYQSRPFESAAHLAMPTRLHQTEPMDFGYGATGRGGTSGKPWVSARYGG